MAFQKSLVKFLVPVLDHLKTSVAADLRYKMTSYELLVSSGNCTHMPLTVIQTSVCMIYTMKKKSKSQKRRLRMFNKAFIL